jgi:hypothetical protein
LIRWKAIGSYGHEIDAEQVFLLVPQVFEDALSVYGYDDGRADFCLDLRGFENLEQFPKSMESMQPWNEGTVRRT